MDTGSLKAVELALIVGVVGYFYLRQRSNLQRLKEEREANHAQAGSPGRDEQVSAKDSSGPSS